jgi:hypothetical protein
MKTPDPTIELLVNTLGATLLAIDDLRDKTLLGVEPKDLSERERVVRAAYSNVHWAIKGLVKISTAVMSSPATPEGGRPAPAGRQLPRTSRAALLHGPTGTASEVMSDETPVGRAQRIADNPDAASDVDKLRSVADLLDALDAKDGGYRGHQVQDWMRDLAGRLAAEPPSLNKRDCTCDPDNWRKDPNCPAHSKGTK